MKSVAAGFFVLFITPFWLIGLGVLGYGLRSARRSLEAANWPTTPGTIAELLLVEGHDSCEVKVRYTYTVNGTAYEGSRVAFAFGGGDREIDDNIYRKLKTAEGVMVRYNPSDPSVCCLSFGLHRSIQCVLLFAIIWLALLFGFTLLFWVSYRSDSVLLNNLSVE